MPRGTLLSEKAAFLNRPESLHAASRPDHPAPGILWTDDHNNLFHILRWRDNLAPTLALWEKGAASAD